MLPQTAKKRREGGLDSEKHPLNVERRRRDKRSENERVGRRQRQTGSSRGLLIRDSLVSETFELTADLRESIIRLRCAAALIPPCVTRGGGEGLLDRKSSQAAEGELQAGDIHTEPSGGGYNLHECAFFMLMRSR